MTLEITMEPTEKTIMESQSGQSKNEQQQQGVSPGSILLISDYITCLSASSVVYWLFFFC